MSRNYEGERTPYGDAYHGYWISDASQLNSKFGSSDDLKALSDELHKRGMLLMVDVVVNDVSEANAQKVVDTIVKGTLTTRELRPGINGR